MPCQEPLREQWCMIGYHATSFIADALENVEILIKHRSKLHNTANVSYFDGLGDYIKCYVPDTRAIRQSPKPSNTRTTTGVCADWRQLGKSDISSDTTSSVRNITKMYMTESGYATKLSDGTFRMDFDPIDTHGQGFIEGNAWNYISYVPQIYPR